MTISAIRDSADIRRDEELNRVRDEDETNVSAPQEIEASASELQVTREKFLAEHPAPVIQVTAQKGAVQVAMAQKGDADGMKDSVSVSVRSDGSTEVELAGKAVEISSSHADDKDSVSVAIKTADGETNAQAAGTELFISASTKDDSERMAVSAKSDGSADIQMANKEVFIAPHGKFPAEKTAVTLNTPSGSAKVQVDETSSNKGVAIPLLKTTAMLPTTSKKIQVSHNLVVPDQGLRFVIDLRKGEVGMSQNLSYLTDEELRSMTASEIIKLPAVVKNFIYKQSLPVTDRGVFWIVDIVRV